MSEDDPLLHALLALSRGELEHRIVRTGVRDAPDAMAFLFNVMADQIQDLVNSLDQERTRLERGVEELSEVLARMAAADFGARVERSYDTSPLDVLGFLVNATAEELGALYAELKDTNQRIERQARATVSERLAATNTLAAGVGHELRNPLGVAAGNLEYLQEEVSRLNSDPAVLRAIEDARNAVDNAARIATELSLLRPSSLSHQSVVSISVVVERAIRMVRNLADHHARLEVSSHDSAAAALVDGSRLGQVVVNLVHNAALAMPPDRPVEENLIKIWSGPISEDEVAITVSDNGVGMSPEVTRRVFAAFFTTRPVGEGTGLGLAICQSLVSDEGGRLDFESEEGVGTTFRVVLPASGETPSDEPEPDIAIGLDDLLEQVAGLRVLLIDDEPLFQIVVEHMLGDDVDFTATTTGIGGLELLRTREFDAVLSDVMLPDLDGRDIYQTLEREDRSVVSRIGFITGGSFDEPTQAFLESVDAPVLGKPFSRREILAAVTQLANGA